MIPELKQLKHWATTRRLAKGIALATLFAAPAVGGYFLYQWWATANAENMRLRAAVTAELEKIELPAGSVFIYEEVEANRSCKTASISKVYASQIQPIEICTLVAGPLPAKGWSIPNHCQNVTYPFTPRPVGQTRASYDFARFVAGMPSTVLQLEAEPKDSWGPRFMLSTLGDSEAIPLARKAGRSFFTINLYKSEEPERVKRLCPDEGGWCECSGSTLFAWRFADWRRLTISH